MYQIPHCLKPFPQWGKREKETVVKAKGGLKETMVRERNLKPSLLFLSTDFLS